MRHVAFGVDGVDERGGVAGGSPDARRVRKALKIGDRRSPRPANSGALRTASCNLLYLRMLRDSGIWDMKTDNISDTSGTQTPVRREAFHDQSVREWLGGIV